MIEAPKVRKVLKGDKIKRTNKEIRGGMRCSAVTKVFRDNESVFAI